MSPDRNESGQLHTYFPSRTTIAMPARLTAGPPPAFRQRKGRYGPAPTGFEPLRLGLLLARKAPGPGGRRTRPARVPPPIPTRLPRELPGLRLARVR